MLSSFLRTPTNQFGNRTTTFSTEEKNSTAVGRRHLPQLSSKALIIRISFSATFPRQSINNVIRRRRRFEAILSLQLQIKLQSLLQAFTLRVIALARSEAEGAAAAANLEGDGDEGEGEEEAEEVKEGELVEERGVREEERGEEERERVEDVGEVGG